MKCFTSSTLRGWNLQPGIDRVGRGVSVCFLAAWQAVPLEAPPSSWCPPPTSLAHWGRGEVRGGRGNLGSKGFKCFLLKNLQLLEM